eukprot:768342-Hanusia_phi.AAC.5
MPGDSHDSRLPHVKLGLVDGCDLEQVEGRGVQEPEGNEVHHPAHGMHRVGRLDVPELNSVIPVIDEEDDAGKSQRQADNAEQDPPHALPNSFLLQQAVDGHLSLGPQGREAAVSDSEDGEEEEHRRRAVVTADGRKQPDVIVSEPCLRVDPQHP